MNIFMDRNRLYLVLFYFSLSFFYLSIVLEEQDAMPLLGYILALVLAIVLSHDALLRIISQATGHLGANSELDYYSAFMDLNRRIHNFLEVDDVLVLVNNTMRERIQVRQIVYLLGKEIHSKNALPDSEDDEQLSLRSWPDNKSYAFHTKEFEQEVIRRGRVLSVADAPPVLKRAFTETHTSLLVPIMQNHKILCLILIGRTDNTQPYSDFEFQMFNYLANQLSIVLDRIRVYAKVLHKTVMDHAEKMQVMQSLSANIAHEMRTPLSGIRASISGLEEYLPQLLDSHEYCVQNVANKFPIIRDNHLNTLQGTPRRIKLMIDQANTVIDMLLMNLRDNSLDRRQLNPCSAAEIVDQAVDRYPFKRGEREKLHLHTEDDFIFLGVESLVIYILFNLLKNAFYSIQSAQKGELSIKLQRGESYNKLIFRDTGLGIDPSIIDKIFDGFFTTKSDGTGAGLAFCKRTVLSFDGKIECHSILGEYTEFVISLPVYRGSN
ncbi:MAG: GAF domain-containing sensor histidine kinase [Pseudomonadota bacterium]